MEQYIIINYIYIFCIIRYKQKSILLTNSRDNNINAELYYDLYISDLYISDLYISDLYILDLYILDLYISDLYILDLYILDLYISDLYILDLYILDCIYIMTYYNPILSELKLKISYVPSDTHLEESLEMTLDNSLLSIGKNTIEITDTPIKDKLNNADPTLNIKPTLIAKYANNLVTTTDGNIFNNLITPVITFSTEFVTSLTYGSNYVFYPAIISNNSPLQSITYSIINSSTLNTPVASIISGATTTHPVIQINSSGTFQIQAKCNESSDGYKGVTQISNLITISKKYPVINFLPNNFPLLINYNNDPILFPISAPLATLTYNTGQTITYSIVDIDSVTPSTIATISFDGSYLVKNSVGSFRILASVSSNTNYDLLNVPSEIITIQKSTPVITKFPTIPSSFAYGTVFTIPSDILYAITTSNTDTPGPAISYSSSDSSVATISEGMTITIKGLGEFQITVTIGVTPNYNQAIYTLLSTYTSVKATPVIRQYPQINLIAPVTEYTLVYGQSYTINPDPSQISTITSNTDTSPSPNISYTSSDETVATISGSNVTIVGIGYFQILTTVGSTKNYNQILQSPSPQIYYTIQAIPTINSFPTTTLSAQKWVYGQSYSEIIPIANNIPTTNTDTNTTVISYSTSDATIATISGNTITITGVGNFQILVSISNTTNFSAITYNYPTINTYYTSIQATPTITFPSNFETSSIYGSTYIFVPAIISNNNPSQVIQYSSSDSRIATLNYNPESIYPSVVIHSVGTFQIIASCYASTNGFYSAAFKSSPVITISEGYPNITFNTNILSNEYNYNSTYTYTFSETYPIASITNNTGQTLTYSAVNTDGSSPSTVASISSNGTSLTTISVGSFKLLVTAAATLNYGEMSMLSQTITIVSITPTVITFPTLPSSFIYGNTYTIPSTITTTNTDTQSVNFVYSTSQTSIATISGNTITIVGVGNFQISVTIGATANYNQATYPFPSTYTSIQATPTITFPSNFETSSIYGSSYIFVPAIISNNDPSQVIRYSSSDTMVATLNYNPESIYPSVVIHSIGTFQIIASCYASTNGFYSAAFKSSPVITISEGYPNITFNTNILSNEYNYNSTYTYTFSETYPIASITNNTGQTLTYSAVNTDGSSPSTVASISSNGTSLTTISVGSFKLLVTAAATLNYGEMSMLSQTITIVSITPTVITFPTLPSSFIYGNTYTIPSTITTTNTDTQSVNFVYSTSQTSIATISGNTITIVGVGNFQISVTIGATANYNQATYPFPSTYTSIQATPTISPFPSNFGSTWVVGGTYNLSSVVSPYVDLSNQVTYTIINPTSYISGGTAQNDNLATINNLGTQITIYEQGWFQIQANLAATTNFTSALPVMSNLITITVADPVLSPDFISMVNNFVYGETYTLPANPTTINTDINTAPIIIYTIINQPYPYTGATGNIYGSQFIPTSVGSISIGISITQTLNFNAANLVVSGNISQATQTIVLNSSWISNNIYSMIGSQFECYQFVSQSLSNNPNPSYSYTVVQSETINGSYYPSNFGYYPVATINSDYTITCVSPGSFYLNITAAATTNFSQTTISTPIIYVSIVPEVIIFNNPQTFPPSASTSGEVGMAINIPTTNQYPFGFENYSALTITNGGNGATFTLNSQTTPTYSSVTEGGYMVFFDPESQGQLSVALTPVQSRGYIEYVAINGIASGMSSGQQITFTFSGNGNTSVAVGAAAGPNTLTINWNPGSLDLTQGFVYGSYFTLGTSPSPNSGITQSLPNGNGVTVSTLNSGGITGYYIVPWAGYNTSSITGGIVSYIGQQNLPYYSYVTQAWGVWSYDSSTGMYPPTTSQTINGITYYYYVGIPQMANPLQFVNYYQLYG